MDILVVEGAIGYNFKRRSYLVQALTAAGADEQHHDRNRQLAQLGESLIGTVVFDNALMAGVSRGNSSQGRHEYLLI
jgi:dsRNA-specific ribonuclease